MKLPIEDKYFRQIKSGLKTVDFRDAHITFISNLTKETLIKKVVNVHYFKNTGIYPDVLKDNHIIAFELE